MIIERESSIKFLEVTINENLTWRDLIHTVENKIEKRRNTLPYQYYANIAWASTHKTKLKKTQSKQKHALRIVFNQFKPSPSEPPFLQLNVISVYQINIFQSVQFMRKTKNKNTTHIFRKLFRVTCHAYPTNFSLINFSAL